jgi:hypothetical protein
MLLTTTYSTRLQLQHKSLIDIIDGLGEQQIRIRTDPAKWSIFENIAHLQTYQHVFNKRVKRILEEDNPVFERYVPDTDPCFIDNCGKSFREVMADYITVRKKMSNGELGLKEENMGRTGMHPAFGKLSLLQWLSFFLLHESHHLYTIFRQAAELRNNP